MKAVLVIVVNVLVSAAKLAIADECHDACTDVKNAVNAKSSCRPFRNSLPRPKVVRYCQEGFSAAIDENCYDACVQGGRLQRFLTEKRLDETCQRSLKETPRPLCHDACVQGYRSGVKDVSTALGKRMAKAISTAPTVAEFLNIETKPNEEDVPDNEKSVSEEKVEVQKINEELQFSKHIVEEPPLSAIGGDEAEGKKYDVTQTQAKFSLEGEDKNKKNEAIDNGFEEDGLLISLPITVDDVPKELMIFEGDEPMEAVLAFCNENMPDEGAACADQLFHVVQDNFADFGNLELDKS